MDSLLERIEENKLDALYLFINETLRDRTTFDVFLQNLVGVLPHNWSIQRVEVGHEFLSMVQDQDELFDLICSLESLRTLIISDGYVPRKDNGSVSTGALLSSLPRARNLINLDLQRLHIETAGQMQMLESALESIGDSLEEIRITGLVVDDNAVGDADECDNADDDSDSDVAPTKGLLDGPLEQCIEMSNLRSLTISQKQQIPANPSEVVKTIISHQVLLELCQNSTTLQDLCLRAMNLDDTVCHTLAQALETSSFLTSLDLRQNERITDKGYSAILHALERNFDLWCSVMVDDDSFQSKFNCLIELNQANRGDLVRSPTRSKLIEFIAKLNENPTMGSTSLWYFLTIHDSILFPLVHFLQFQDRSKTTAVAAASSGKRRREENSSICSSPIPPLVSTSENLDQSDSNEMTKRSRTTHS